jgi:hypothetical protein
MSGAPKEFGQRAGHVGQAAGLGVRINLTAREQDFHAALALEWRG